MKNITLKTKIVLLLRFHVHASFTKGIAGIQKCLEKLVKKEKPTEEKKNEILSNISGTNNFSDTADCDLIVEASVVV